MMQRSSQRGWGKSQKILFLREANVMRRLPVIHLPLLLALLVRGLRLIAGILRMLLGLRGVLLALGMVIFAVSIGRRAMQLRCGFVVFSRLVVFVLHGVFSLLAEECRLHIPMPSIVAAPSAISVLS
jgi:hypothetical protein